MLVNLKWMENYALVIKSEKLIIGLEILLVIRFISTLLIRVMDRKMPFAMVNFTKSILLNLLQLMDLNMEMVVILNMKLLNIEVITVIRQQKIIVLPNVLPF